MTATLTRAQPAASGPPSVEVRLDHVIERFARDEHLEPTEARRRFGEMLDFLDHADAAGEPSTPSRDIDAAWHTFILHTPDYSEYCDRRFGRYLHHRPTPPTAATDRPAGNDAADCSSEEASCKSEGNCTADCKSGDGADTQTEAEPEGTSA